MSDGFDLSGLVKKKDISDPAWRNDPNRIAKLIRDSAKAFNIRLKEPDPSCKKCYGRGWISVNSVTGDPVPCTCIFHKEDLQANDDSVQFFKPKNRKERRARERKNKNSH